MIARASFAFSTIVSHTNTGSEFSFEASTPASYAIRATVRIVPSAGFVTALYAASMPIPRAAAIFLPFTSSTSFKPCAKPLKRIEVITPELPRAPLSIAEAAVFATSPALSASQSSRAFAAAITVIDIFVPVSPSGTGKILRSLI